MKTITLRAIELVVVGLTTGVLLPVSALYAMDLAAGIISPDLEWALLAALGIFGLWMAVLKPDSFYRERQTVRWGVVAALVASIVALANLVWGSSQSTAPVLMWLILGAPVVVGIHQLVRLTRLQAEERR